MDHDALLALARTLDDDGYRFVTPTPATHARVNARPGNRWARTTEDVFGWSRPFRAGLLPDTLVATMHAAGVIEAVGAVEGEPAWRSLVRVSSLDGMLFVHSAYPTLAADSVFFGPDTYRYVAAIASWLDGAATVRRACDIGCGAGAGAMLVARARPEATVYAGDINDGALALTRVNAVLAGLGNVVAQHSDLLSGVDGPFDLVVANPPYLADPAERAYRHGGGPLGAGLSLRIVEAALLRLSLGGTLLLYTGAAIVNGFDAFRAAAAERLAGSGVEWVYREVDPDVFGEELEQDPYRETDRIAAVVLTATRKF